ncbi:hypothetical protein [Spiroplasma endosymbiont of Asaphidion curtum]|uniref:hypothetical protein n=1 Tax=Spiroplasma endosymbiont of Asaphidion curtum TaxID=3066281 RepID=UPI00313D0C3A
MRFFAILFTCTYKYNSAYKKVKVKIVILHKSILKLSSWWFFLFYQEFSTKLKLNFMNFMIKNDKIN